jgi:hypothetical protein
MTKIADIDKDTKLNQKDIIYQEAEEELGYILAGELKTHEREKDE